MTLRSSSGLALAVVAALGLSACQNNADAPAPASTTESAPAPSTEPAQTPAAAPESAVSPVTSVEITGNDAMQFSQNAFTVKAGTEVTVTLRNVGTQPKETMGHNFVVLTPGSDVAAFASKYMTAKDTGYMPADGADPAVVAHTKLLGPGESDTITFTVPSTPGDYPYLCSFPGHYAIMQGVMKVVA